MDKGAVPLSAIAGTLAVILAARSRPSRHARSMVAAAVAAVVSLASAILVFRRKTLVSDLKKRRNTKLKNEGASDYIVTAFGVREWSKSPTYKEAGSPGIGDVVTWAEAFGISSLFGGLEQCQQAGFLAKKEIPVTTMTAKDYEVDAGLDEWCEKGHEEPAQPLWPTVDPHHHIFDKKLEHGADLVPPLVHSFSKRCSVMLAWPYEQLAKDMRGNNVVATVFIECGHGYDPHEMKENPLASLEETRVIQEIADKSTAPMAIVAHLDLSRGRESVERAVKAHREAGRNLVGVRHSLAWVKDRPVCSRNMEGQPEAVSRTDQFREGMEVLAESGLSYDCWLFHTNLQELLDLARACPRTLIICDHVGDPLGHPLAGFDREATFPEWRTRIQELAECKNVVVKLSGLSMPNCGFRFELGAVPPTSAEMAAAYRPYFAHCLKCFGPTRCFFASNFPVDKASGSFTTHWNAFKLLAEQLLPGDEVAQRALFYDNTVRTYQLDKEPFNLPSTSAAAEAKGLPSY